MRAVRTCPLLSPFLSLTSVPVSTCLCLSHLTPNATSKDTASGRRQQRREIEFLLEFNRLQPYAANIVGLIEARTAPFDMLLVRKEPMTLTSMLESARRVDFAALVK